MMGVSRLQRQHQPIQEAAALTRAAGEQPVHGGGKPEDRESLGQ